MYTIEEVRIASLAYQDNFSEQQKLLESSGLAAQGWVIKKELSEYNNAGLWAVTLVNDRKNRVALSIAGTRLGSLDNLLADIKILLSVESGSLFTAAQNNFERVTKYVQTSNSSGRTIPYALTVYGHSLGGAVAQMLMVKNLDINWSNCVAFEPPGLKNFFSDNHRPIPDAVKDRISIHISSHSNLVNSFGEHIVEPRKYQHSAEREQLYLVFEQITAWNALCGFGSDYCLHFSDSIPLEFSTGLMFHRLDYFADSPGIAPNLDPHQTNQARDTKTPATFFTRYVPQPTDLPGVTSGYETLEKPSKLAVGGAVTAAGGVVGAATYAVSGSTTVAVTAGSGGVSAGIGVLTSSTLLGPLALGAVAAGGVYMLWHFLVSGPNSKQFKEERLKFAQEAVESPLISQAAAFLNPTMLLSKEDASGLKDILVKWVMAEVNVKSRQSFLDNRACFWEKSRGKKEKSAYEAELKNTKEAFVQALTAALKKRYGIDGIVQVPSLSKAP